MDNYDKKIENIIKELDAIDENILNKAWQSAKGFAKGLRGEKLTDSDKEAEGAKHSKGHASYVATSGSESMKKAAAGDPEYYQIGKNKIEKVDKDLQPFLHFDVDPEKQKDGKLIYISNSEKVQKNNPQLEWLFKGVYFAKELALSKSKLKGRGSVNGRLISFTGVWESGAFMGILKNGEIKGGQIIDGYYIAKPEGFQIKPWDFKSGGLSVASGFAFGLRLAKDNTKYKSLSLVQIPSNKIIKIIDNADKEHLINMDKGVDYTSLNMKINDNEVSWEYYNKSEGDFKNTYMIVGENFEIPGVTSISKGIQSIEIKTKEYEGSEESSAGTSKAKASTSTEENRFDIKTKEIGWTPGGKSGYYILDIDINDEDLVGSIKRYKDDINSGQFFKYLRFFKSLVDDGRVDGYGVYPGLAFLFPKTKGISYKDADSKRDQTLKYFERFREDVVDNFKSDKIGKYYLSLIKKRLEIPSKSPATSKKTVKTSKKTVAKPVKGRRLKVNEGVSISGIVKKVLKKQELL